MNFWSKGLGKKTIDLYLSKGEVINSGEIVYVKGQMEAPVDWEYIMPMTGQDFEDFLALIGEPAMAEFAYNSDHRWKLIWDMVIGGLKLAGLVLVASVKEMLGQGPKEEAIVLEIPPPSVRNKKRAPRRRLGAKKLTAPSAESKPAPEEQEQERAASAGA